MGKNQSASNLPNIIQYSNGSINFVSGSTLLMQISSSGAITTTGVISGSNALSSSYAVNADQLDGFDSTAFVFTSSFNTYSSSMSTRTSNNESTGSTLTTASASFAVVSSSYSTASGSLSTRVTTLEAASASLNTASGSFSTRTTTLEQASASLNTASGSFSNRVTKIEGNYATTGSNIFTGAQTVCANITSTGTIIAQTLNVQQVTSSVVYSSGSNVFGCSLANTQQFTGSVLITGSLVVTTTAPELTVGATGVTLGNVITDIHNITGSLRTTGSITGVGNACFTSVCSPSYTGGTFSGTTIAGTTLYGSTAVCAPTICGGNVCGTTGCFGTTCSPSYLGGTFSGTTISGTTINASTAVCGPTICGGTVCGTVGCFASVCSPAHIGGTFSGTTVSGTTLYGSTAACAPTILGTTVVSGSVGCFVSICSPTHIGGTFSGTTLYGSTVVCGASMCTTGNTCFGGMTIVANCLGIGTATPGYKLEVIYNQNSAGTIGTRNSSAGTAAVAGLQIGNDQNPNAGGIGVFSSGYTPANAYPVNGTYVYSNRSGGIAIISECATAPLYLGTCNLERMRITSAGCVGINASSPCRLLDVRGTVNLSTTAPGVASTAGAYSDIHLRTYGPTPNSPARITVVDNWMDFVTTYTDGFRWYNYTSDGVTAERMRLTTGGNLSIGDRAPEGRLHLFGCVNGYGANLVLTNWCNATGVSTGIDFGVDESTAGCGLGNAQIKVCNIGAGLGNNAADMIFSTWNGAAFGERLRISCNGNVGIGTSPSYRLDVCSADSETARFVRYCTGTGTTNGQIAQFVNLAASAVSSYIYIGSAPGLDWKIGKNVTNVASNYDFTIVDSNNNIRLRIDSSGITCIPGTVCTPSGVKYGNGSSTLNYYEEGTWTPVLQGSSSAGTVTYAFRSASYVRIGNYVFVRWGFKLSSIAGASGTMRITGLPFTAVNWGSYQEPNVSVSTGLLATADYAQRARVYVEGGGTALQGRIANNADTSWDISEFGGDEWVIGEIFYNV